MHAAAASAAMAIYARQCAVLATWHAEDLLPALHCLQMSESLYMICSVVVQSVSLVLQLIPNGLPVLLTLTEAEADNFAIFLREILQSINGWWVSLQSLVFLPACQPVQCGQ